jgi:hypothetical protein
VTVAVFLDISNSFENCDSCNLIEDLNKKGLPYKICNLLWNLVKEKRNHYTINNETAIVRTSRKGFSQGLPPSPLMFNLDTADIKNCLTDGVESLEYEDDVVIYCKHKDVKMAEMKIQETLRKLRKWEHKKGFKFSPSKCEVVAFSRKHVDEPVNLWMGEDKITQKSSKRFLGVELDRKLLMKLHAESVVATANKGVNFIKAVSGTKWGMDPQTLLTIYKGLVRSKLEYCCFVYSDKNPHVKKT